MSDGLSVRPRAALLDRVCVGGAIWSGPGADGFESNLLWFLLRSKEGHAEDGHKHSEREYEFVDVPHFIEFLVYGQSADHRHRDPERLEDRDDVQRRERHQARVEPLELEVDGEHHAHQHQVSLPIHEHHPALPADAQHHQRRHAFCKEDVLCSHGPAQRGDAKSVQFVAERGVSLLPDPCVLSLCRHTLDVLHVTDDDKAHHHEEHRRDGIVSKRGRAEQSEHVLRPLHRSDSR